MVSLHFGLVRTLVFIKHVILCMHDGLCNKLLCYGFFFFFVHHSETEQGIFEEVLHGNLDFQSDPWPSISESAKDLVRRMLIRDPKKRLTAHEVLCEFSI